jgi:PBSX family phage terminase large subunit
MISVRLSDCIAPNFHQLHKDIKGELYNEIWCRGGRGSTKSSFISIEIIKGMMQDPDAHAVCFRRYNVEVQESVHEQLEWATYQLGVNHLWRFYTSPLKAVYLPTGQTIRMKGADKPGKIKSTKFKKGYLKFVWFEEIDQFGGMNEIRSILQSLFRGTEKKQIAFFSYNPPKSARSWTNSETKIEKAGRFVHFSDYRDIPKEWLGEYFLAAAEHLRLTNKNAYDHEYLGLEVGTGLEIFDNVTIRKITDDEIAYFNNINQGIDFGYTTDPLSFVRVSYDTLRKRLFIFFDYSGVRIKYKTLSEDLDQDCKDTLTMADKASPRDIDQLRDDFGFKIIGADKPPGSVDFGTKWLQDLEEIIIDPLRSPLSAKEFVNYSLNVTKSGEVISQFPDKDNHSIDAVRYACIYAILQERLNKKKKPKNVTVIPTVSHW